MRREPPPPPRPAQAFAKFFPGVAPPVAEALHNLYTQLLQNIEDNSQASAALGVWVVWAKWPRGCCPPRRMSRRHAQSHA
jgi:hypothetical protein